MNYTSGKEGIVFEPTEDDFTHVDSQVLRELLVEANKQCNDDTHLKTSDVYRAIQLSLDLILDDVDLSGLPNASLAFRTLALLSARLMKNGVMDEKPYFLKGIPGFASNCSDDCSCLKETS